MALLPGFDAVELMQRKTGNKLADAFTVPPFSVLNAMEGSWQERKRMWLDVGIRGEVGRKSCPGGGGPNSAMNRKSSQIGEVFTTKRERIEDEGGTSVFDPTLCELAYRWFCPPSGIVLDPFAGGSVRGIVAVKLARRYWGCDLRQEQIDANERQADEICNGNRPVWICGDSASTLPGAPPADFIFSCPPYGNLERYSDDPRDLSTMDYPAFRQAYFKIVGMACGKLRDNRFACFVVGDFRDKEGNYCNFVSDTIRAFQYAGLRLYNEAILITAVGSLPIRVTKQFTASRKLGKTHQNVLVFVKGSGKEAAKAIEEKQS